MLERIREFSYWLGIDPLWIYILIGLTLLLFVVKCKYPWAPKWKSITTKDKDGNIVTKYYRLSLDGRKVDEKRLEELINLLGLSGRRTHLPNELSGGQQQKTSIGRAMITNPAIILADEPTGNLDSKSSDEVVTLLKKSNKDYKQTIIMITHNLEIAKVADRIITIEDGKIVKEA